MYRTSCQAGHWLSSQSCYDGREKSWHWFTYMQIQDWHCLLWILMVIYTCLWLKGEVFFCTDLLEVKLWMNANTFWYRYCTWENWPCSSEIVNKSLKIMVADTFKMFTGQYVTKMFEMWNIHGIYWMCLHLCLDSVEKSYCPFSASERTHTLSTWSQLVTFVRDF